MFSCLVPSLSKFIRGAVWPVNPVPGKNLQSSSPRLLCHSRFGTDAREESAIFLGHGNDCDFQGSDRPAGGTAQTGRRAARTDFPRPARPARRIPLGGRRATQKSGPCGCIARLSRQRLAHSHQIGVNQHSVARRVYYRMAPSAYLADACVLSAAGIATRAACRSPTRRPEPAAQPRAVHPLYL